MQSKISFFNMALFKKNLSRTWIVALLYLIFLLLLLPINYIISIADYEHTYYFETGYTKSMMFLDRISMMPSGGVALFLGIIIVGITFWFLFNKRDNYMMHAFPVSRTSLYVTGFISASLIALIPLLINGVITSIITLATKAYCFDAIWYWTLVAFVSNELFIAIAMFAMMTSGQIVTSIVFYFIFSFLYFMMEVAFRLVATMLMFGMSRAMDNISSSMLTPAVYIGANCGIKVNCVTNNFGKVVSYTREFAGAKYLIIYAIAAVVILAISYILYTRKKLETVQDFIAIPFLKPVFTVGMSFFISMVAGAFVAQMVNAAREQTYSARFAIAIVSALIIGAILFYATQMMIEKTVRVFCWKRGFLCIGYSIAALVALLCIRFDAFKIEDKVPNANDLAWVGIQCDYTMVFTDEDEINTVLALHKTFLEDKKELRDLNHIYKDITGNSITIKYKFKDGHVMYRDYGVVDTEDKQVSAEYIAAAQPFLDFLNSPNVIKTHILGNIWNDCTISQLKFGMYEYNDNSNSWNSWYAEFPENTDPEKREKYEKVYEALLKDIDEGNVLQTRFSYSNNYDRQFINDFSVTLHNSKVPYFSDEETYWEYADSSQTLYERNIYVSLNKDCVNTLKALYDEGFYTSEDQIVTNEQYDAKYVY